MMMRMRMRGGRRWWCWWWWWTWWWCWWWLQSLKWLGVEDQMNDVWAIGGIPEYICLWWGYQVRRFPKWARNTCNPNFPMLFPCFLKSWCTSLYVCIYIHILLYYSSFYRWFYTLFQTYNPVPGPERVATELPMRRVIEVRRHVPWIATWNLLLFYVIKS